VIKTEVANQITWTTQIETNTDYFTIEKSVDGVNFSSVAQVKSKASNGVSNGTLDYDFQDSAPFYGYNYYRLAQTNRDGFRGIVSEIKLVQWTDGAQASIYPNPVSNSVSISYNCAQSKNIEFRLFDATGKLVATKSVTSAKGNNTYTMDMEKFACGTYQLHVADNKGYNNMFKITKQ
jgi:hypothetical protein